MDSNRPPPRPGQGRQSDQNHPGTVKRPTYTRNRTTSSGSVRGAFGPRPIASAQDQDEIYEMQNAAMSSNFRNINGPPRSRRDEENSHGHSRKPPTHKSPDRKNKQENTHKRIPSSENNTNFMIFHHSGDNLLSDDSPKAVKPTEIPVEPLKQDTNMDDSYHDTGDEIGLFTQFYRHVFYDHTQPEFSSLQQNSWAIVIGIFMGFFTAFWAWSVESLIEIFWAKIPAYLLEKGVFTDLDGRLPLPHYFWICPAIWGGVLAWINALYVQAKDPVPGQNEWIETLHRIGVMDYSKFFHIIGLSTGGMASGLSLGPEMPLVLSAGMVGSYLALKTKQSVLSARVMNLAAASAGIGGFFGMPMAGALFVLELPHRMGLQYFEAVSPAVLASIIAVIVNRYLKKGEITGLFEYPFLSETLPGGIFYSALIYGLFGTLVGICYADGCFWFKTTVHDWFHAHDHDDHGDHDNHDGQEKIGECAPLIGHGYEDSKFLKKREKEGCFKRLGKCLTTPIVIRHEPTRAAVVGVLAGMICGVISMFLPHALFWGEAQLQTLIDRGATPLPFFEYGDEPTSILTAYGYCMIDPEDQRAQIEGFGTTCAFVISASKILTIGVSLGTGVPGGQFWGPLYVGCAASHFFTDVMTWFSRQYGIGEMIGAYPCIAMICIMGSTHIVTFRAHIAIMLILTLSITSFSSELKQGATVGDYSAIFPILVVACFVPLLLARDTVFYKKQCSRGDIVAIPEVLCEPMKDGHHEIHYEYHDEDDSDYDDSLFSEDDEGGQEEFDRDGDNSDSDGDSDGDISLGDDPPVVRQTHSRSKSLTIDPLSSSMHSAERGYSPRGRASSRDFATGNRKPSPVTRLRSFGEVQELQPTLLDQSRSSRSGVPVNIPGGPPPRGHRRKGSTSSITSIDMSKHSYSSHGGRT